MTPSDLRVLRWLLPVALAVTVAAFAALDWDARHAGRQVGPVPAEPVRPVYNVTINMPAPASPSASPRRQLEADVNERRALIAAERAAGGK